MNHTITKQDEYIKQIQQGNSTITTNKDDALELDRLFIELSVGDQLKREGIVATVLSAITPVVCELMLTVRDSKHPDFQKVKQKLTPYYPVAEKIVNSINDDSLELACMLKGPEKTAEDFIESNNAVFNSLARKRRTG